MKRYLKPRYIVLGIVIIVFCFVPVIDMEYQVIVEKQVLEKVQEPYTEYPSLETGLTRAQVRLRTVTKEVTRLVVETRTKRVSILRYLLR